MHIACMILKLHPEVHMLKAVKFNFFCVRHYMYAWYKVKFQS